MFNANFLFFSHSRKDVTGLLEKNLKIDTLLLAGTKGSYGSTVQALHAQMDKQKTQLLKIDDVGDVINEAVRESELDTIFLNIYMSSHRIECVE